MIVIENLGFSYGSFPVLKNICLKMEPGKIYGLLGENGVGKTTMLMLLAGLKKPCEGKIDIDGGDPYMRMPSLLGNQYYLSDDVLKSSLTASVYAQQNGKFWPRFNYNVFLEILQIFEVEPSKRMDQMSTGQLKKTHLAFALSLGCRYLFLDEPTNGLDIPSKAQFRKAVMTYMSDESTLVISTHQVKDLENIIDPIIIMDKMDILVIASLSEIAQKLYFDYGTVIRPDSMYSEQLPGGWIQVCPNPEGLESKVNIEALFGAVHKNKELLRELFLK